MVRSGASLGMRSTARLSTLRLRLSQLQAVSSWLLVVSSHNTSQKGRSDYRDLKELVPRDDALFVANTQRILKRGTTRDHALASRGPFWGKRTWSKGMTHTGITCCG